jgi:hypothetical protein
MTVKDLKERPIIFSAPMVQAILDGRKTQTRRIMKPQPDSAPFKVSHTNFSGEWGVGQREGYDCHHLIRPKSGVVGDLLWVREAFGTISYDNGDYPATDIVYRAHPYYLEDDGSYSGEIITAGDLDQDKWLPPIYMPRRASRITLRITNVRVERLRDISERDAIAEGVEAFFETECKGDDCSAFTKFAALWLSIYGAESWQSNPWVWVVEFERVD